MKTEGRQILRERRRDEDGEKWRIAEEAINEGMRLGLGF